MKKKYLISILFIYFNSFSFETMPIAHRGASGYAPENTISAINKAQQLGIKYFEIDVHLTKDGEVVALHDSTIDRTSNGSGKVFKHDFKSLSLLDFGA